MNVKGSDGEKVMEMPLEREKSNREMKIEGNKKQNKSEARARDTTPSTRLLLLYLLNRRPGGIDAYSLQVKELDIFCSKLV